MRIRLIWLALLIASSASGQTYTVETVPNEKTRTGSYVSNPDGILTEGTVKRIDEILGALEQSSSAQVAVVVLNSISEADHVDFAQELFQLWGIGHADNDNGLLILFILDQHKIRFHTGFGVEGILTDKICKRIEMEQMVPEFKDGKYNEGMLAGVERAAALLNDPELVSEGNSTGSLKPTTAFYIFVPFMWSGIMAVPFLFLQLSDGFRGQGRKKGIDIRMTRRQWALMHIGIPLAVLLATVFFIGVQDGFLYLGLLVAFILTLTFFKYARISKAGNTLLVEKEYRKIYNLYQDYQTTFLVIGILFPPMLLFFFFYLRRKKFYRNHPRTCQECGSMAIKLDEKLDDNYLEAGEVFEENLGSVDYDVWQCTSCKSIEKISYVSRSTKYTDCPHCNTKSLHSISRRTIKHPSYSSSGKGEEIKQCKFCQEKVVNTYSIAKLTTSSSSSSSGGSSSSSSFGGGSSGGGGSSSSW
jgi:uncharacterized protein